jgi:hypothetical protein
MKSDWGSECGVFIRKKFGSKNSLCHLVGGDGVGAGGETGCGGSDLQPVSLSAPILSLSFRMAQAIFRTKPFPV